MQDIPASTRLAISKVSLLLGLFASYAIPISVELVVEAYEVASRLLGEGPEAVKKLARKEHGEEVLRSLALGRAEYGVIC